MTPPDVALSIETPNPRRNKDVEEHVHGILNPRSPRPFCPPRLLEASRTAEDELILTQGYLAGVDSTEFIDFRPGQLSQENKRMLDNEYSQRIELELRSSSYKKGNRRREKRREAVSR